MAHGVERTVGEPFAARLRHIDDKLRQTGHQVDELRAKRNELILEALRAGASYGAVGEIIDLPASTIRSIAVEAGWQEGRSETREEADQERKWHAEREWRRKNR